jgi:hypothetical protein
VRNHGGALLLSTAVLAVLAFAAIFARAEKVTAPVGGVWLTISKSVKAASSWTLLALGSSLLVVAGFFSSNLFA